MFSNILIKSADNLPPITTFPLVKLTSSEISKFSSLNGVYICVLSVDAGIGTIIISLCFIFSCKLLLLFNKKDSLTLYSCFSNSSDKYTFLLSPPIINIFFIKQPPN